MLLRAFPLAVLFLVAVATLPAEGVEPVKPANAKEIREKIDAAVKLVEGDDKDAALKSLAMAVAGLDAMASQPRPPAGFKMLADRAEGARRRLERAGVDVSALVVPGRAAAAPAAGAEPPKPAVGNKAMAVSFSRQVAPILAKSCGGCHVAGRKGDFQMTSYEGLMRSGMVQRGAGNASRLVEVILTGDMPRGGGKISSDDVATLVKWIDAGAAYDGTDPTISLDILARGGGAAPPAATPAMAIKAAPLRPGDVSFAADVAPIVARSCLGCHGGGATEAGLSMASLDALMKGGRTSPAVVPGKGAASLLVKKLRGAGIDGQRMPLNKPPLPDAEIAIVEKWIDQGARLDMLTSATPLENLAAAGRSKKLSDAELTKLRSAAGVALWRRAIPDEEPTVESRPGVCAIGNLPAARMVELADVAAEVAGKVRGELVGDEGPLLKGGIVLIAVKQAFDYSAIWQNILGSERPKGVAGHAGVSGDVVYGAMLVPSSGDADDLRALVAEAIGAAAFAGRTAPPWFARGAGRAVAARVAPKADVVALWRKDALGAVPRLGSVADFLGGHADPSASALAAGGFITTIATGGKLAQVRELLDAGAPFDDAFSKVFKATPAQALERWASRAGR
jgi:cytochrome c553